MNRRGAIFVALGASVALTVWAAGCGSARRDEPITAPLKVTDAKLALGQRMFAANCDECHVGGAGGYGPALNNKPLPGWYIKTRVRDGLGAMPSFDKSLISDEELDAIAFYLQSLRAL
jgi:mono/diheme cytochrome c family protein